MKANARISIELIERRIHTVNGKRIILDVDLAKLYGVKTKVLNQAVKRNSAKFPKDFMFGLTAKDLDVMTRHAGRAESIETNRSQTVTGSQKHRNLRSMPYAFTEHGALMAANVLRSERAVKASIFVVRAFIVLRETLVTHQRLTAKLSALEKRVAKHDIDIHALIEAIRTMLAPPEQPRRRIGF